MINKIKMCYSDTNSMFPIIDEELGIEIDVLAIDKTPIFDSEILNYWGNSKRAIVEKKYTYKLELKPKAFPKTETDLDDYYYSNIFEYPFLWIWENDYKIKSAGRTDNTWYPVLLISHEVEHDHKSGTKKIKVELECI